MARFVFLLVAFGLASSATAQQSIVDEFERRSIDSNGLTMSYGLFVPENYDPNVSYPLVMAAHGAGERGTDLRNLPPHRLATSWADPANQANHPAFVYAPQVPSGLRWTTDADPDATDYVPIQLAALDALSQIEAEFNIDPDRIYVVGLSLGGHATWDFVSRDPDRFAAAVPMSGRGFTSQADDLINLPIWAFTGETDGVVPASQTRRVIQAMEDLGRSVLYTDCRRSPVNARGFDCGVISQDSLDQAIDARADLIYESRQNIGHGPWAPWFDRNGLHDWLFSHVRQDPDAVTITSPTASTVWNGATAVTWTSARDAAETAEVWYSANDGDDWILAGTTPLGDGSVAFDASIVPDTPLARLRIVVLNTDGRVVGRSVSPAFRVDGSGNSAPVLSIDDEDIRFSPTVTSPTYTLNFTAADAEEDPLTVTVSYSTDGGATYEEVQTVNGNSRPDPQALVLNVSELPNSAAARFRVELSDGTSTVTDESAMFTKTSERVVKANVTQVEGTGRGTVRARVVDESVLTGHRYRVIIDGTDPFAKTFSVVDLDVATSAFALQDIPLSDGTLESPVFDGVALIVQDAEGGEADASQTGWTTGASTLIVDVVGDESRISILTIPLLATETTYTLTMTAAVAGTSVARYAIPEQDVFFTVTGDDGQPRTFVFDDKNNDGMPGSNDRLFIQEPDANNELQLAWELKFTADGGTVLPVAGDVFTLVPSPKLSSADAFEFATDAAGVDTEDGASARSIEIVSGYPNPFTERLTVDYRLEQPSEVRLDVIDALGRRVATLVEGAQSAGDQRTTWSADVASGVFFLRLTATPLNGGPSETVQRSVLRVGR
ncbi:MAG: hypothetical protein Rubg2KO_33410 [Rubricoccaceae bacterium]